MAGDFEPQSASSHKTPTMKPQHAIGKIAETLGTGENAKNSIVWLTIKWSFLIASLLSLSIFVRSLCLYFSGEDYVGQIKDIWSTFVPIITLALGYAFGKSE